jgi:hypothetical protein
MTDRPFEFAGDRVTYRETADGDASLTFDDRGNGRVCGECTLCCKLLPVPEIGKAAGQRCRHVRAFKGCSIYARRPGSCRAWACRWVADREGLMARLPRPDRAGYVIDTTPDYVTSRNRETGEEHRIPVIQIWVDPARRDAWRSPALLDFLADQATRFRTAAIIRWNSRDGLVVFAPAFDSNGEWHEMSGDIVSRDANDDYILALADKAGT